MTRSIRRLLPGLACALLLAPAALAQTPDVRVRPDAPPRLLVKLKPAGADLRRAAAPFPGFTLVHEFGAFAGPRLRARGVNMPSLARWIAVEAPADLDQRAALAALRRDPRVELAEPDPLVSVGEVPNDPRYGDLWGMHTIRAPEAWELETGSAQVIVAVIDTGVDYTHPDLSANMWTNADEIPGNGVDDDGNGFVDDFYGYDFANRDPDPRDDHLHGTHCAGTVGAVGDNGEGVVGVCWNVRIMALKFMGSGGSGYTSDAIKCIQYAVANGADVLSNSWGGSDSSSALREAIQAARQAGVLFVAAAGNSGDTRIHYPGYYPESFTVAATDRNDALASFSTRGEAVDVAAPGVGIVSCALNHGYRSASGTSMATPHVAGLAALIKARNPRLTPEQLELVLTSSVVDLGDPGKDTRFGHGRIDAAAALASVSPDATEFPDLRLTAPISGQVVNEPLTVIGTAAGATFASYRVDYLPPGGSAYQPLHSSTSPVVDGALATLTPRASWVDGAGAVRLTVTDTSGATFRTAVGFRYLTTWIDSPLPYAEVTGAALTVRGTAGGPGFRAYTLEVGAGEEPRSWTTVRRSTQAVAGDVLATWRPVSDGVHTLRLRSDFTSGERTVTTAVTVERTRLPGWPAELTLHAWGFNDTPRVLPHAGGNRVLASYGPGVGVIAAYDPRSLPFLALEQYDAQGQEVEGFDPANVVFGTSLGTPAVGDLDRDGVAETVVLAKTAGGPSREGWTVHVLAPDGARVWTRQVSGSAGRGGPGEALTALADLDGDGFLDVICGGSPAAGSLQAFDRRGDPLPGFPVRISDAKHLPRRFAIADLDGDLSPEVAFWLETTDGGHRLCVYRADGSPYLGTQVTLGAFSGIFEPLGPAAADVDGDGLLDLVAAGWGAGDGRKVFALRPDGRLLPGWPFESPWHMTGFAPGDLDGDGKSEVVLTTYTGEFKVIEPSGALSATLGGGDRSRGLTRSGPVLADFDGDGRLDVVYKAVHEIRPPETALRREPHWIVREVGYRGDGIPLAGFPKQAALPMLSGVAPRTSGGLGLADVDGDGTLDLLTGTSSLYESTRGGRVLGRLVVHRTRLRAGSSAIAWPTYAGNRRNTGVGALFPDPHPDVNAPQVRITAPAAGAAVFLSSRVEFEVSDDVAVERLEVLLDGEVVATLTRAPWSWRLSAQGRSTGPALLGARAYDPAGNVGEATPVEVRFLARTLGEKQEAVKRAPVKKTVQPPQLGGLKPGGD